MSKSKKVETVEVVKASSKSVRDPASLMKLSLKLGHIRAQRVNKWNKLEITF